jgi:hypothetical protein
LHYCRELVAAGLRRTPIRDSQGNIIPISLNMEPTSIEVAPNGFTAYVTMPVRHVLSILSFEIGLHTSPG